MLSHCAAMQGLRKRRTAEEAAPDEPSSSAVVETLKALDIYLAFCFTMVFGALLEYATVTYSSKRIKMNQKRLEEFQRSVEEMRSELARKLKMEQQLVIIEDEARTCRSHAARGLCRNGH